MPAPVIPWYENPLFLTPAFGLLGVIVGGLITAGSSYLLDQRREDRETLREERTRTINMTTAARMIELDFRLISAYLKVCIENKFWSDLLTEPPTVQNWEKYCTYLAPEVSKTDWIALVVAAGTVGVNLKKRFKSAQERSDKTMSDEEVAHLVEVVVKPINEARHVLLRLAGSENIEAQMNSPEASA